MARKWVLLGLGGLLVMAMVLGTAFGAVSLPIGALLPLLKTHEPTWAWQIVFRLRLPRVLLAAVVGSALAVAGVIFQAIFRNPLADPYLLGVSAGAALGAVGTMAAAFLWPGLVAYAWVTPVAFLSGTATLFLVYAVGRSGGNAVVSLLLSGAAVSSFLSALLSLVVLFNQSHLAPLYFWLLGGLAAATWQQVGVASLVVAAVLLAAVWSIRDLDAFILGDEGAHHLGLDVPRVRLRLALYSTLLSAVAVAFAGMIGFVGLIVPHAMRLIVGSRHGLLLPASALAGASFLILADLAARTALSPQELPVGVITAFLGAPFFIWLLKRSRGGGWLG